LLRFEGLANEELMAAFQKGDKDALGVLLKSVLPQLGSITRRRFSSNQTADDVLQEALITIIKNAKSFRGDSKVLTWMYAITSNACVDYIRREQTRSARNVSDEPLAYIADETQNFANNLDTALVVRAALGELPKDQNEALTATWIDGYSVEEASVLLGVPSGTIKSRCDRGKKALAEKLRDLNPNLRNQGNV
jgi:RNA polymerase sigma-70 factor (ECF subfamily)